MEEVRHFTMANKNMHLIVFDLIAREHGMSKELKEQKEQQRRMKFSSKDSATI